MILPPAVSLNRLAAALRVLSLSFTTFTLAKQPSRYCHDATSPRSRSQPGRMQAAPVQDGLVSQSQNLPQALPVGPTPDSAQLLERPAWAPPVLGFRRRSRA